MESGPLIRAARLYQVFHDLLMVENPTSAIIDHLEGNGGPVLDHRNTRPGGLHADTESSSAVSLVIADDELVRARRGVEVSEGRRGSRGGDQHAN